MGSWDMGCAANIQGIYPHLSKTSLRTPSRARIDMHLPGDSKYPQVDNDNESVVLDSRERLGSAENPFSETN